jgi:tRNA threonylcarbamoyladenosine biosynthesis protein TsaE
MDTCISHSPGETSALGEAWARQAQGGWIIALSGDLGAGKTELVKGLARGLGIAARVHSPTFALLNVYEGGRWPLYHLDLYRLQTVNDVLASGLAEYLPAAGITVVEWAERLYEPDEPQPTPPLLPRFFQGRAPLVRWARLEATAETERRISYEDFGH